MSYLNGFIGQGFFNFLSFLMVKRRMVKAKRRLLIEAMIDHVAIQKIYSRELRYNETDLRNQLKAESEKKDVNNKVIEKLSEKITMVKTVNGLLKRTESIITETNQFLEYLKGL